METLGNHYLAEYHGCDTGRIDDPAFLEATMREAAERAGATIVQGFFHRFSPHGASGVLIIAESHFTIHCWPERGYAAADFFSCGDVDAVEALRHLGDSIGASDRSVSVVSRGGGHLALRPIVSLLNGAAWK